MMCLQCSSQQPALCFTHSQGPAPFLPLSAKNPINCISLHIRFYTLFQIRLNLPKSYERCVSHLYVWRNCNSRHKLFSWAEIYLTDTFDLFEL